MKVEEEIKDALHRLGKIFPNEGINIEVDYYFNCRDNRRTFTIYIPSVGAVREFNRLDEAIGAMLQKAGKTE